MVLFGFPLEESGFDAYHKDNKGAVAAVAPENKKGK